MKVTESNADTLICSRHRQCDCGYHASTIERPVPNLLGLTRLKKELDYLLRIGTPLPGANSRLRPSQRPSGTEHQVR